MALAYGKAYGGNWIAGSALVVGLVMTLLLIGSPGQAYRTDEAFSASVASVDPSDNPEGWEDNARACVFEYRGE